ncbi:efflux RND transporter periplasmic adaptor subunit [Paraherbaspirillum soli]|uniref:Efflux RND transporter periplasmic adaptor subunit n=1 Tax=Paraherbaspirillum soli TaxID=631222 RepID=A0ABW0MDD2_9BURK
MKSLVSPKTLSGIALTSLVVAAALLLGDTLWNRYMNSPWTRDGRVRADVIDVAADVSGLVVEVPVHDNAYVHKGQLLMKIDPARYRIALAQADALVAQRKAALNMKRSDAARRAKLDSDVISSENRENASADATAAQAVYQEALAARDAAQLNLQRTEVRAQVDGWVSNLNIHAGDFAQAGVAKLALIDAKSFWVYGYFEETKLPLLKTGGAVEIRLLGGEQLLSGHIDSISRGITDRDNPTGSGLLANVNPSFNWVRLAQRVPVRIHIDHVPAGVTLAAGMTCTVIAR